jgi:hypothetical protein
MIPDPLHPAIVHFPIVLMFVLPVAILLGWAAIRRGAPVRWAWLGPLVVSAAIAASAWAALETGEDQEDRAEKIVGDELVDAHKEAGEWFLNVSAGLLVVTAAGLMGGTAGKAARGVAFLGSLALIGIGYQVGRYGGRIVYGDAATHGLVTWSDTSRIDVRLDAGEQDH